MTATDSSAAVAADDTGHAATRVLLVRHGETDWNTQTRLQGHTDIPLNARGREQARRVGQALAGIRLDAVYSSDLQRAFDTARAMADATGAPLHAEPALRERQFGCFEGLTYAEVEARWPEPARRWRLRDPAFGPDGGETLAAFHARCLAVAERLVARHAGGHIALVAHGGVLDSLYRAATRVALDAPRSWRMANASLNRLLHGSSGFVLVGWDDDTHLQGL
ncbi:MAG: histidine phosphatase family protein [Burkholderiaceae bacterium]|nr:histidine phosphatase family protein [Burkholderiaceae bacterium]